MILWNTGDASVAKICYFDGLKKTNAKSFIERADLALSHVKIVSETVLLMRPNFNSLQKKVQKNY
jgi:hypothetical protein